MQLLHQNLLKLKNRIIMDDIQTWTTISKVPHDNILTLFEDLVDLTALDFSVGVQQGNFELARTDCGATVDRGVRTFCLDYSFV